jgi:hypothetical protein
LTNANDVLSAKRQFQSTIFLAAMASYLPTHDGLLPLFILFVRRIPKTTLLGALTKSPGRRRRPGQCHSSLHYSLLHATPLCRPASLLHLRLHKDNQDNDRSFRINLSSSGQPSHCHFPCNSGVSHLTRHSPVIPDLWYMDDSGGYCEDIRSISYR